MAIDLDGAVALVTGGAKGIGAAAARQLEVAAAIGGRFARCDVREQADNEATVAAVAETGFRRDQYAVYVWRSVRKDGDTKTEKSRRTLEIPDDVAKALKEHHAEQARQKLTAGKARPLTWPTSAVRSAASPRPQA